MDVHSMGNENEYFERLSSVDVTSLRLLALLVRQPNLSAAAQQLSISQPTASRKLAALRQIIGDPLLVRSGAGLKVTDHASKIAPELDRLIAAIESTLAPSRFDPATDRIRLTVAGTDYAVFVVAITLMRDLARTAPGIAIDIVPLVPSTFEAMREGAVDLALYANVVAPEDFVRQYLFDDRWVALIPSGHPLAKGKGPIDPKELALVPRAEFSYPSPTAMIPETVMADGPLKLTTPHMGVLPRVVTELGLVASLPERLARTEVTDGIAIRPFVKSRAFKYYAIWHERKTASPARRFVVQRLLSLFSTSA